MKVIELTRGRVAIVDDEDFDKLAQYRWNCSNFGYAQRSIWTKGQKPKNQLMHRLLISAEDGQEVDHKNGNTLDNRKCNLRVATRSQNTMNMRRRKDNTSGFKGVDFLKREQKFRARIHKEGREISLGYFSSAEEASTAYKTAAIQLHGDFARLN